MNKFYFSRTYVFDAPSGRRKHYFFNLLQRHGAEASFRLNDKGNDDAISSSIVLDGDTETASFRYKVCQFKLRADHYIPKGYPLSAIGREEKIDDMLKDAHLHTSANRSEIERSQLCGCICCQSIFPAVEVEDYIDNGETALCPQCDCDSLIADASGIVLSEELLSELNKKYF